jgi:hypothetical protein
VVVTASSFQLVASQNVLRGEERARAATSRAGGGSRGGAPRTSGAGGVSLAADVTIPRDGTLVEDDGVRGDASLEHASGAPPPGVGATTMNSLVIGALGWITRGSPGKQWSVHAEFLD